MSNRKIKVAIVGQGRSGYAIHARVIRDCVSDLFELIAVADPLSDRCREAADECGALVFSDHKQMLVTVSPDLVVNATPSNLHLPITTDLLNMGHNVLCEKPFGRSVADFDAVIACAEKSGKLLAVFQQSRFSPTFLKVREVIASGVLGRPVMIKIAFNNYARRWDWQTLQCMDAGNLLNTGPHPLDQALELFGAEIYPEVFCHMDRAHSFGDAEDHVKVLLRAPGHPVIDMEISSCCAFPQYVYQVYGTQGGLTSDHAHIDWKYFVPEENQSQQLIAHPMPGRSYCSESLQWYEESWDSTAEELEFMSKVETFYRKLYGMMVSGEPFDITLAQIRRQIAVIEECHRQNPLPRLF